MECLDLNCPNKILADERREQLELAKDPNIKTFTYSMVDLEQLPKWKNISNRLDLLIDIYEIEMSKGLVSEPWNPDILQKLQGIRGNK